MNTPTPAIVAQAWVSPLPRWVLLCACLMYGLLGFWGHDPWKNHELATFGQMHALADAIKTLDLRPILTLWQHPTWPGYVAGGVSIPLPLGSGAVGLGAIAIVVLPFLAPETASKLPFALGLLLNFSVIWYTAYYLARLPTAQPVIFAFGGEARPKDYARTLADCALLAILACLGMARLSHEVSATQMQSLGVSLLLLSGARGLALPRSIWHNSLLWITGLAWCLLTGLSWIGVLLGVGVLSVLRWSPSGQWRMPSLWWLGWLGVLWGLTLVTWWAGWMKFSLQNEASIPISIWLKGLSWFLWPLWPIFVWGLWCWRRSWWSAHMALPLVGVGVGLLGSYGHREWDRVLFPFLPCFALLTSFALPTLERSVKALIDWFALIFFSGAIFILWAVWLALHTGWPTGVAANLARLAPGFQIDFNGLWAAWALLITVAWVGVVRWRTQKHQAYLWKSLALPAFGALSCWVILFGLWFELLDYGKSYRPLAQRIAHLMKQASSQSQSLCLNQIGLDVAQWSALRYLQNLELRSSSPPSLSPSSPLSSSSLCPFLLITHEAQQQLLIESPTFDWTIWAHQAVLLRIADRRKERFYFYRRIQ